MAVLVIADHDGKTLRDTTHKTVAAATGLSADIDILVLGQGAQAPVAAAAKISGVRKVLVAESEALGHMVAEAVQAAVVPLMAGYEAVLSPANTDGKNFAPRVAAALDVAVISDIVQVVDGSTFIRPIYAGNALETVQSADAKKVITVRPTVFKPQAEGGSAPVEKIAAPAPSKSARFVSEEVVKSARPELGAAKIVVSGAQLVGQTGKVVAPDLYLAIGISGAIQHLAGMKDSKVIVAINKDADAPIFQVADYGLVADYKTAVPELMAELGKIGK